MRFVHCIGKSLLLLCGISSLLHAERADFEAYFGEANHLEGDTYEVQNLGTVWAASFPWVYVETFGWLYLHPSGSGSGGFWAYDLQQRWVWTRQDTFPYVYNADWKEWYYFLGNDATGERWFYNAWTRAIQIETGNPAADLPARAEMAMQFAAERVWSTAQDAFRRSYYPSTTNIGGGYGDWNTVGASNWVSGFFPAELWLLYDWTGASEWRTEADLWLNALEGQKTNTTTHDLGFMLGLPYSWAFSLTGETRYRDVLVTASDSLMSRYSETVGAIRSWSWGDYASDGRFTVIIDNMMNLEMPYAAASMVGGNSAWKEEVIQHALTTARSHIRADGSTYHVVIFDENTGATRVRETFQGYGDESTWSRGQAWGIYGYTSLYGLTEDVRFLETARTLSDYFIAHLDETEKVPPYDFDAPGNPVPRDSSAAAIAASALLQLSDLETDTTRADLYWQTAEAILFRLTHPDYLARNRDTQTILLQGSSRAGSHDQALIYGDYYFLEALLRYLRHLEN